MVSSAGRLGMVMSSARFKRDIQDMGSRSGGLLKLRPVTFRYKNDPSGALQYGLVAEEVAKVYPELVSYGPDGKPMTVRYLMLSAMLLNELQKQATENQRLMAQVSRLSARMIALKTSTGRELAQLNASRERDLRSMQERLAALEQAMKTQSDEKSGRRGTIRQIGAFAINNPGLRSSARPHVGRCRLPPIVEEMTISAERV